MITKLRVYITQSWFKVQWLGLHSAHKPSLRGTFLGYFLCDKTPLFEEYVIRRYTCKKKTHALGKKRWINLLFFPDQNMINVQKPKSKHEHNIMLGNKVFLYLPDTKQPRLLHAMILEINDETYFWDSIPTPHFANSEQLTTKLCSNRKFSK